MESHTRHTTTNRDRRVAANESPHGDTTPQERARDTVEKMIAHFRCAILTRPDLRVNPPTPHRSERPTPAHRPHLRKSRSSWENTGNVTCITRTGPTCGATGARTCPRNRAGAMPPMREKPFSRSTSRSQGVDPAPATRHPGSSVLVDNRAFEEPALPFDQGGPPTRRGQPTPRRLPEQNRKGVRQQCEPTGLPTPSTGTSAKQPKGHSRRPASIGRSSRQANTLTGPFPDIRPTGTSGSAQSAACPRRSIDTCHLDRARPARQATWHPIRTSVISTSGYRPQRPHHT